VRVTDARLRELIAFARDEVAPVGPLHAMWDVIHDAEAPLDGRRGIVEDREWLVSELLAFHDKRRR